MNALELFYNLTDTTHRSIAAVTDLDIPNVREDLGGPPLSPSRDALRVTGTTEVLALSEPDLPEGSVRGLCWMADAYVEFRPERYPSIIGRKSWWRLPRVNALASILLGGQARVLRTRFPSVLMKMGSPRLTLCLPDDHSIFRILAVEPEGRAHLTGDARLAKNPATSGRMPYARARHSEKGRYLEGLIGLFEDLPSAADAIEERYWRRMFDLMSGRHSERDAFLQERVRNSLLKRIRANPRDFYETDKSMNWLVSQVLKIARELPSKQRERTFLELEKEAKAELDEFTTQQSDSTLWKHSPDEFKQTLGYFTARHVLLMGVQARCPVCGMRGWHNIDDAKHTMHCPGCNSTFAMPPERPWSYRLNSLVSAAYAEHGLLPVLLVLGQLFQDARSAFLFAPCMDLFEDREDPRPCGDLDITAIVDGQWVIGEIKESPELFDTATFIKMETIARRLRPDVLLFASLTRQPTRLISEQIERLSEALQPQNTAVRWYQLHEYKFSASPLKLR